MSQITKQEALELEWQGRPGAIKWARAEYRRLRREGQSAEAHLAMVSPYYSAVKRNALLAPYRLLMACHHSFAVMMLDEYTGHYHDERSAAELNVLAAPFARMPTWVQRVLWPLSDTLMRAHNMVAVAVSESHPDSKSGKTLPHDRALNLMLLMQFKQKLGVPTMALEGLVREALALESAIYREKDQRMARRQFVRILFDAGTFYRREGRRIRGQQLIDRAYGLAFINNIEDQCRKIKKAL